MSWFCRAWREREEGWGINGISWSGACRTCTGPSVAAPADSVTACTHIVGSRAAPRQERGDPLISDGCLNIIPLEQAEQEEMRSFTRMGRAQLPAFPPAHGKKCLAVEALSAGRTLDQEHHPALGLVLLLQDLICLQVLQLLAPPCCGYLTEKLQGVPFLLSIYPLSILHKS